MEHPSSQAADKEQYELTKLQKHFASALAHRACTVDEHSVFKYNLAFIRYDECYLAAWVDAMLVLRDSKRMYISA